MKTLSTQELARYLDELLDVSSFNENTYNGIQVANTAPIKKVATAVSASLEAIEKAAALKAQILIVHHGLFRKNDTHPLIETRYKKVRVLIEHNIALLAYHLPLDAHQELGNNWKAAKDLGLADLKPFGVLSDIPIGVIGTIAPLSFEEFRNRVEAYYGNTAAAVVVKNPIRSVAIISGGADKYIHDAAYAGADCFITGRFDEPVYDAAHEENISFLGLGHYATETVGVKALAQHIQETCEIPCTFIKTENPF